LSFSPDGKALAVLSGESGMITVFETATGKALHRLSAPAATIAYSPDGTVLAAQLASGAVQLWDARSLKPAGMLQLSNSEPIFPGSRAPIAFSPDGKFLAASTGGPAVTIWDVSSGKVSATLTGHNHSNPAMAFSPDDRVVYLGASRTELQVWDANTGKYLRGIKTEQSSFSIAVSEDGNFVASGGRDRIIVADTRSGKELSRLELPKLGAVLDVAFTPDAKTLLSWTEDGKVRVWDLATRKERLVLDSRGWLGRSMAVSRDGKLAAAGTVYNVIRVWDVATGKEISIQADGHDAPIHSVAFAPDGKTLVTGGANKHIHVWDAASGRQVRQLTGQSASQVSFSPDGKRMASTWLWNKHARIWDMDRGVELCQLAHDSADEVHAIGFSPNGKTMVSASWKRGDDPKSRGYGFVQSWDASNGKSSKRFELQASHPTTLALSPRGDLAAVGGWGEAPLHLCDLQRSRTRVLPLDRFDAVKAVAFSPDGRLLASGGIDRENVVTNKVIHRRVVVWEVLSGRPILKLSGHERTISALAFAPGGRVLASADGGDNFNTPLLGKRSIRFWDMRTGKELTRIEGHESDITSLAFSPDGKKFVCGLHAGTALIWETPPVALTPPEAKTGRKLGPRELAALWEDLTRADPQVPYEAIQILAASPERSVPFLASVLHPVAKIETGKVRKWIADLGSEDFAVREAGSKALSQYGDEIGPELRKALAADPSPEVRRRLQALLAAPWPPVRRKELRAVWVLELIGTPAARKLLESLANGEPDAALTREARRACSSLRTAR
ncbi:MAG TPA: hypothetical protein VLM40_09010, partial [Gemmata sp.]|nr:hypothetical protein [Gemmata sp.]